MRSSSFAVPRLTRKVAFSVAFSEGLTVVLAALLADGCVPSDSVIVDAPDGAVLPAGVLSIDPATIEFGYVNCGAPAVSKTVRVENTGGQSIPYVARIEGAGFSLTGPTYGTLAPSASASFVVSAMVEATAQPRVVRSAAIVVDRGDGSSQSMRIPLTVIPDGALLSVTPTTLGFGQVRLGESGLPMTVTLRNTGYAPISVGFDVPSSAGGDGFGLSWTDVPAPIPLSPSESKTLTATFAPTKEGARTFRSALHVTGAVCGDVPPALALSGEGLYSPVTAGPSPLDFGAVDCGTTAPSQSVTLHNDNGFNVLFSTAFTSADGGATRFTVSPSSGTLAGNGSVTLTVTPAAMSAPRVLAANAYGDTLTITTGAPGDSPHVIDLRQSARGALLTASLQNPAFGLQANGSKTDRTVTFDNAGNAPAAVTMTTTAPFSTSPAAPAGVTIPSGMQGSATVSYSPTSNAPSSANVAFSTSGPVCSSDLPPIAMTGSGAYPLFTAGAALATFDVTCGTTAASHALQVSNGAAAAGSLLITNVAVTGPFTVNASSLAAIAPGASGSIVVTPKSLVSGVDLATQIDSGTLTFKTNEAGFPTKSYALKRVIHGANLDYGSPAANVFTPISELDFDGCPGQTPVTTAVVVRNSGDQDAAVVNFQSYSEWTFSDPNGGVTATLPAGATFTAMGAYHGPITASRAPVSLAPIASLSSNVCTPSPTLALKYTLHTANDAICAGN